ncbi:MAG TPA: nucleoside hydrolase [Pseudonocardia sp.]|nr:nucleoside hydrolase [Pseudonocardia sp.]HTF54249.1 nucleoside hydrolase [Pseudonocardia sp.]
MSSTGSAPAPLPASRRSQHPESAVSAHLRPPFVIDTDPGIDDALAILLGVGSPEARLLAVTTVFGNVGLETTTTNARRLLALAGRTDVPVAAGADRPLVAAAAPGSAGRHHADGLGGRAGELPEPGPLHPADAVALLAELLRSAAEPVTLASIGPLTNTASLLAAHPELTSKIVRIVVMGGRLGDGTPEFNVSSDPEAAHRVLAEQSVPVTLVPLDLTVRCAVPGQWLAELAAGGPRGATLSAMAEHNRARFRAETGADAAPLHDVVAVLEAVRPGTLRTEPMRLAVLRAPGDQRGRLTVTDRAGAGSRPVDVAVDAAIPLLQAEILRRLRTLDTG